MLTSTLPSTELFDDMCTQEILQEAWPKLPPSPTSVADAIINIEHKDDAAARINKFAACFLNDVIDKILIIMEHCTEHKDCMDVKVLPMDVTIAL